MSRSRTTAGLALVLLLTVVVGLASVDHVPDLDLPPAPDVPADPAALDRWLAATEASMPDITPGAEKHVAWAHPDAPARTPVALVYLHGFSATRQEVSPLCEQAAAALGANVFFTRLRGHGRPGQALAGATVEQWAEDGVEALAVAHALGDRVVVVGTSTGGTLATWLAAEGADFAALVLISPNFGPRDPGARVLLWPGRSLLVRLAVGETREWQTVNAEQARYWTWRYPARALFPMAELVGLVERTDLSAIHQPVLLISSPDDEVVRPERARERLAAMSSEIKRVVEVSDSGDPSRHVIAGRILSPGTTDRLAGEVARFVDEAL